MNHGQELQLLCVKYGEGRTTEIMGVSLDHGVEQLLDVSDCESSWILDMQLLWCVNSGGLVAVGLHTCI